MSRSTDMRRSTDMSRSTDMNEAAISTLSRREFIEGGAALGIGAALGQVPASTRAAVPPAPVSSPMPLSRPIPSTGERLPVIGIGTDSFREGLRDEIRSELRRMIELGGTVIDTSDDYGDSEMLIGESLQALDARQRVFLATKCSNGAGSFTRSLGLLKTTRVDLLQVHNLHGTAELIPVLQEWKKAGKVRYVGITTSRVSQHGEMVEAMRRYPLDFIQVDYSIDNREAARTILPLALERRLAVLVNLPFGHSSLFRKAGNRPLPPWAADIDVTSWAQFFLKYVISHAAVTCAIPGSTSVSHLEDNQGAGRGRLPDEPMRRKMEEYWDRSTQGYLFSTTPRTGWVS